VSGKKRKRKYRKYSPEFKQEAVTHYRSSGKTLTEVAAELNVPRSALTNWVRTAEAEEEEAQTGGLTSAERKELIQLRKDLKRVRMERDFLKKATAFFANQKK
jgi:transposase